MRPAIRRENVSALCASAAQIVVTSAAASTLTLEQMNPLQDNFCPPSLLSICELFFIFYHIMEYIILYYHIISYHIIIYIILWNNTYKYL